MIKWLITFGVWVRMKSMLKSVEIQKYIKDTTYLEKSHICNRNWKQSMIQAALYHLWFGNSKLSKCFKKKKGQKWVQRMVENFKGNA